MQISDRWKKFISKIKTISSKKQTRRFFVMSLMQKKKKLYSLLCDAYFEINDDGNVSKGWLDLPLTFVACNHIDEPRHELWGNGTQASSVEWMTSHRDCTCRDEHLEKKKNSLWFKTFLKMNWHNLNNFARKYKVWMKN